MPNSPIHDSARTALASAFFLSVLLALYLPVQLYSCNAEFMHFPLQDHLLVFVWAGSTIFRGLLLTWLILLFQPARQFFSTRLAVLALFMWLNSFLLTYDHGRLDGTGLDLTISATLVLTELFCSPWLSWS